MEGTTMFRILVSSLAVLTVACVGRRAAVDASQAVVAEWALRAACSWRATCGGAVPP